MPYLPPLEINQTQMPKPWARDLHNQLRMIEEQYRRFRTRILYYPIIKATTPQADFNTPVGEAGATKFDPLYGEAVDATMTTVVQPHLSGTFKAANPEVFAGPIPFFTRVQAAELDETLKKYGFDKTRDLVCTLPVSVLDRMDVTVTEGDYFVWDGHPYTVKEVTRDKFFQNTNIQMFVVFGAVARRVGS